MLQFSNPLCALLRLISATVFDFALPPVLFAPLLILSFSLHIPRARLSTVGFRAFSVFGPSTWNDLPLPLRQKPSLDSFKCNLKTVLFPKLQTCHVFLFRVAVFIPLKSLLLPVLSCQLSIVSQNAVCVCVCVCVCCLLYTSPSPRDGLKSRMPSSA